MSTTLQAPIRSYPVAGTRRAKAIVLWIAVIAVLAFAVTTLVIVLTNGDAPTFVPAQTAVERFHTDNSIPSASAGENAQTATRQAALMRMKEDAAPTFAYEDAFKRLKEGY